MATSWPDHVRAVMVQPQHAANREADKLASVGNDVGAFRLRVFGRINGIENALIALSQQLEEMHRASG